MSLVVKLIISAQTIKDRMALHTNVDDKIIVPEIKAAQDTKIMPLLGDVLFNKIVTDVNSNDGLAGKYKILYESYLIDCTCNHVMSELAGALNYQFWNAGVLTKNAEGATTPNMDDMFRILSRFKNRAEHYAERARRYVLENVKDFPEYYASGGVDRVLPDRNGFSSPIFLDDDVFDERYGRPNRNPNLNSNDPGYLGF